MEDGYMEDINEAKPETTQIQVSKSLANELKVHMRVGDTYESVIRRLLALETRWAKLHPKQVLDNVDGQLRDLFK